MKNPMILGFYGESDTGKTTLITKIIERLVSENLTVATVKITDKKIGLDKENKDTWRHSEAGAKLVVLSSPIETDFILKENRNIKEMIQKINRLGEYDIILIEGAKSPEIPKIRIGEITERENTILTYQDNFEEIITKIKNTISRRN